MAQAQIPSSTPPSPREGERPAADETVSGAAAREAELAASPELMANTLGEYLRAWVKRVRSGDSGVLPILGGLVAIVVIFQLQVHVFLSALNLTNLLVQGAVFVLLGMAEIFVLLLGEIDLSVGFVAGVGAVVSAFLMAPPFNLPWFVAVAAGLASTTFIGAVQGTIITRLHLPSFVVTLAGLLGCEGLLIYIVNTSSPASGGTIRITSVVVNDLVNGNMGVTAGWVVLTLVLVAYAATSFWRDRRRRRSGLSAPPMSLTVLKVLMTAVAGIVLVWICNSDRGILVPVTGIPWVIPAVLVILLAFTFLQGRTRFGRYVYAIGGNSEAARRAGINLARIRTISFALSGLTAGMAGIVYESRLGSISTGIDGGTLVLYAVAAAVIGGASLFGGRGKAVHALLGGLLIAAIYNGMGLLGLTAAPQYMITAVVLLAAVTVDAVARRSGASRGTNP
jgi:D-xylose transport system permease protein